MANECPIWGTTSGRTSDPNGNSRIDSPRAGGSYRITGSAEAIAASLTAEQKVQITNWLVEERRAGNTVPLITADILADAGSSRSLTVTERRDRLLDGLIGASIQLGWEIFIEGTSKAEWLRQELCALSGSRNDPELRALLTFSHQAGLIKFEGTTKITVTFEGWIYWEQRQVAQSASEQCFVAMWFSPSMEPVYHEGIAKAIEAAGYSPRRIDKKDHNNKIDDEIIAEIRKSRFLVADFTSEPDKPRGGVYFEAGFAMGLGIPVIWMCHEDLISQVHFDTRQYNHILWNTPEEARERLRNRILATIGQGPLGS